MDECKLMGVSPIPRIIAIPRIYIYIYTWQANVRPIPSRCACCYKVSITLRVMRINDTLGKEFMTFLLPVFSDLIIPRKG